MGEEQFTVVFDVRSGEAKQIDFSSLYPLEDPRQRRRFWKMLVKMATRGGEAPDDSCESDPAETASYDFGVTAKGSACRSTSRITTAFPASSRLR